MEKEEKFRIAKVKAHHKYKRLWQMLRAGLCGLAAGVSAEVPQMYL